MTASVRAEGVAARAQALSQRHHGTVGHVWKRALRGFSVTMSEEGATKLAAEPDVEYVEQVQRRKANTRATKSLAPGAVQTPVSWGLDRIDQHALPLDNNYAYDDSAGQGVHVYVMSTGIQVSHPDFGGRAVGGGNFIPDGRSSATDCEGGGTGLAGIVGGTQYGVAKLATMVAVRVFGCNGVAVSTSIEDGFEWVIDNAVRPAVIVFELADLCFFDDGSTGPCPPETAQSFIEAQEAAFASGIAVVTTAGDHGANACGKSSGAAPNSMHIGATSSNDARASFSNFGPCVTMYAPGDGVATDAPSGTTVWSYTSASAALVAGTVALFMSKPEFAGASPGQVRDELTQNRSTPNVITGLPGGSPNKLLFTGPPGLFTTGSSVGLAPNSDGRLEMLGVSRAGYIVDRGQIAAGSNSWSAWTQSTTKGWLSVAAEPNADGRIELTGLTPSGDIWPRAQATAGSNTWFNWTRLSRPSLSTDPPIGRVAMAYNRSNRLEIFATNHLGQAFYRSQTSPGSKNWTAWTQFSAPAKLRSITAVANADGRIEVLGVDDAGRVWRTAQTSPTDNNWSTFAILNGFAMATIAAARNGDGTLELVGIDTGGGVWRRRQVTAGATTWSAWTALPSRTLAQIAAETNTDGRIQLVGVDNLGNIWQSRQTAANSNSYIAWTQVDGQLRP